MVMMFATRAVADEWWRAMSTCSNPTGIQRISPQFYTHDVTKANVYEFFYSPRFKVEAEKFRGRMFLQLENDRGGRGISIIPPQEVTDHLSGRVFYVRLKAKPPVYWHYNPSTKRVEHSSKARTKVRIVAEDLPSNIVMIGKDTIRIEFDGEARRVEGWNISRKFKFEDFENVTFEAAKDGTVVTAVVYDGLAHTDVWELV